MTFDQVIEACARASHEVNRAYCVALGDTSQPPWEHAPEWQRESAKQGVVGVLVKGNSPKESHASWYEQKKATGWVYGPVKDPEKREHPCMVPYDKLPGEQKVKDDLFTHTVTIVGKALNFDSVKP